MALLELPVELVEFDVVLVLVSEVSDEFEVSEVSDEFDVELALRL